MPTYSWGGAVNTTAMNTATPGDYFYSDAIAMPTGVTAANGNAPIRIESIAHASLTNGYSAIFYLANLATGGNTFGTSGGTFEFRGYRISGTSNVGRNSAGGGSTYWASGGSLAGIMPGSFVYTTVPSAPLTPGVTGGVGQATVTWAAPASDGESSITGYRVQYATNALFTLGVGTVDVGVVTSTVVTGLTNGITYYFRVYAKNLPATDSATTSVASSTVSAMISIWTYSGAASYRFTVTAVGTAPNYVSVDLIHAIDTSTLSANENYSASIVVDYAWSVGAHTTPLRIYPFFEWLNSVGSVIGTVPLATVSLASGVAVITFSDMVKPGLATSAQIRLNFPQTNAAGTANFTVNDVVYADAAMLVNGSIIPFFDGNTAGASWAGTANNSVSSQASPTVDNILYDATVDDNKIYSVEEERVVNTVIKTANFPTVIAQPVQTVTTPVPGGSYYVTDSAGLTVSVADWTTYGGLVQASLGDTLGSINLSITGPSTIPGYTGPFYLAYLEGGAKIAALSIAGSGVITDDITLNLPSGADPEKTTVEVAQTINIPFISTLAEAYDRGVWAQVEAAGPVMTLTATIPVNQITGFGVTPGSLIEYDDSIYRVTSCTISGLRVTIKATWYVTAGDFDAAWSGQTAGTMDALWADYEAGDRTVAPLRTS